VGLFLFGKDAPVPEHVHGGYKMNFYQQLDQIMKQDMGGRGLLGSLPENPIPDAADALKHITKAILLTGFPVKTGEDSYTGETDGPSGTSNLARALTDTGVEVLVVTDRPSYPLLKAALAFRAPKAKLAMLPESDTDCFIRSCIKEFCPSHLISLERPGKATDGHYHNMRGKIIDSMVTDSSLFLSEAKQAGAVVISIGDGGNEMGMGTFRKEVEAHVPCGDLICTSEAADITLAAGVSNWWGWGLSALLSLQSGHYLLPTDTEEKELLHHVVLAGGVDGCTGEPTETVDHLSLSDNLSILHAVSDLVKEKLYA